MNLRSRMQSEASAHTTAGSHRPDPLVVLILIAFVVGAFVLGPLVLDARANEPGTQVRSIGPDGVAPERLSETGLYSDVASRAIAPSNRPYTPQYPLWSDGATKRRWVHLPEGATIDASNPDAWEFPVGTKFWKEFAIGNALETRYLERREDGWVFAAYAWNADGTDAVLVPSRGTVLQVYATAGDLAPASGSSTTPSSSWDVPSFCDCLACHEGRPERVLGFTALQLSTDRDPFAPHAASPESGSIDLAGLLELGLLTSAPSGWPHRMPRIEARSANERATLGYLYGNCSMCHNETGPLAELQMSFDVPSIGSDVPAAIRTVVGTQTIGGTSGSLRISPGDAGASWLLTRMASRSQSLQMPPLGTHEPDSVAIERIARWIRDDLVSPIESPPESPKVLPRGSPDELPLESPDESPPEAHLIGVDMDHAEAHPAGP
ncbi:MAG: hypothetical protein H6682_18775 [Candidatus Eisenbacteria bacterium]|nr:hypothetical protein [Candidatus Eisenbacteria bacterium]